MNADVMDERRCPAPLASPCPSLARTPWRPQKFPPRPAKRGEGGVRGALRPAIARVLSLPLIIPAPLTTAVSQGECRRSLSRHRLIARFAGRQIIQRDSLSATNMAFRHCKCTNTPSRGRLIARFPRLWIIVRDEPRCHRCPPGAAAGAASSVFSTRRKNGGRRGPWSATGATHHRPHPRPPRWQRSARSAITTPATHSALARVPQFPSVALRGSRPSSVLKNAGRPRPRPNPRAARPQRA